MQGHLFEVYANEECTERPQVGQSYERLYVKVNDNLTLGNVYDYDGGTDFSRLQINLADTPYDGYLYVDFACPEFETAPVAGEVIECVASELFVISEGPQVSFGPVIG